MMNLTCFILKNAKIPIFALDSEIKTKLNKHCNDSFILCDILIKDGLIKDIAQDISTKNLSVTVFDIGNKICSPGFIDVHSHSDIAVFDKNIFNAKFLQGITGEIVGNCGLSVAPIQESIRTLWKNSYSSIWGNKKYKWTWENTETYLKKANKICPAQINTLTGYSTLRFNISGMNNRKLTLTELKHLSNMAEISFKEGSTGISLGIGYPPNIYADKNEYKNIFNLCQKHNKILSVHMRDEGNKVIESLKEMEYYLKIHPCKLHISHLKCFGKNNWHKTDEIINCIEQMNSICNVTFDLYPYTAGSTTLNSLLPLNIIEGGFKKFSSLLLNPETWKTVQKSIENGLPNWENYGGTVGINKIIPTGLSSEKFFLFKGLSIKEISEKTSINPFELICRIIYAEKGNAGMIMHSMNSESIKKLYLHKNSMVGSDSLFSNNPHPRTYGTFPKFINEFVNKSHTLTLHDALLKCTKIPAEKFGFDEQKELKIGKLAFLTIFDLNKIKDNANFNDPNKYSSGIYMIISKGKSFFDWTI